MKLYTDNIQFAERYFEQKLKWQPASQASISENVKLLSAKLFTAKDIYTSNIDNNSIWQHLFLLEYSEESQYDILIKSMEEQQEPPHGTLCIAGSGKKFHGFKNRPWESLPGNLHLSAFLSPQKEIKHFGVGFLILSAVSVLQTLDSIEQLKNKAAVKWVNDILIDGAKVCGVLAHTQTQGNIVTGAVLGIGLNVERTPNVSPTIFVPKVASINDFITDSTKPNISFVFDALISFLDKNYKNLLNGNYLQILELYRSRSLIIGKKVKIFSDESDGKSREIFCGIVKSIGDNLELMFEENDTIITNGRLALT